jgi:hypothetical protein
MAANTFITLNNYYEKVDLAMLRYAVHFFNRLLAQ